MNRYDKVPYVKRGRDMQGLDCWGLVRLARKEIYGFPFLPSYAEIDPMDKRSLTEACAETVQKHLMPSTPMPGHIAAAYQGRICVHVGIVIEVDGITFILETDDPHGVERTPLRDFERRYSKVIYYV